MNTINEKPDIEPIAYCKTAYFNPYYKQEVYSTIFLTSGIESNGFYYSGFIKRIIPFIYLSYQKLFIQNERKIQIYNYLRQIYHSKGKHYQVSPKTHIISTGSSNHGIRSYEKDDEIYLLFFNPHKELIFYFHNEFRSVSKLKGSVGLINLSWLSKVLNKVC